MNHPPRLLGPESRLRHIPSHAEARDKVLFDGLRYSLEIADAAHRRLREVLWQMSISDESDPVDQYVTAVSDAWSIVDSLNRLQSICKISSGFLDRDYCRSYAEVISPVIPLRNAVQHLHGRIDKLVADKETVWGLISWVTLIGNPPTKFSICVLAPGTLLDRHVELIDLPDRPFFYPVDAITLTSDKKVVSLSDLMSATAEFADRLDEDLRVAFPSGEQNARDLFIRADGSFNDTGVRSPRLVLSIKHDASQSPQQGRPNRAERRKKKL